MTGVFRAEGNAVIAADPALVWSVLGDFQNVGNWAPEVTASSSLGEADNGLGAGRRCHIRGVGEVDEFVTHWEPPKRLRYSVSPIGPIRRSESDWRVDAEPNGGTRVSLALDYQVGLGVLGRLLNTLIIQNRVEQSIPRVLSRLRRFVEEGNVHVETTAT